MSRMLTYDEFSDQIDRDEDRLIELGEYTEESISLQSEYLGAITYDRAAEMYSAYLKEFGIFNTFIGVKDSSNILHILQIKGGSVIYKVRNPLEGFRIQLVEEPLLNPAPSFVGQDGENIWIQQVNSQCTLVHCEGNLDSPFEFRVRQDAEDFVEAIAAFRMRDRLEKL